MKKSRAYQPDLSESLRAREAEVYLNAALEEEEPQLLVLRNVTEARNPKSRRPAVSLHALGFRRTFTLNR